MISTAAASIGGLALLHYADTRHQLGYDLKLAAKLIPMKISLGAKYKANYTAVDFFNEALARDPIKEALVFEGRTYSFKDLDEESNRVGQWGLKQGLKTGDTVAIFLENCPEFITTWLGLAKIGCKCAFINYNLKMKPLTHSLAVSGANILIFGPEQTQQLQDVWESVGLRGFCYGDSPLGPDLGRELAQTMPSPIPASHREGLGMLSTFALIYTSGTTGLPKPAIVTHAKLIGGSSGFCLLYELRESDRFLTALPLYHTSATLAVFMSFCCGLTVVLLRKFSVKSFWDEVVDNRATAVQYIGELCRYLTLAPPHPLERSHDVRVVIGNGMRPDVWETFQTRFGIPEVGEFYGSTEGQMGLFNHCKSAEAVGAVGRMGSLVRTVVGMKLVKFDVGEEEVIRNDKGFCEECGFDEPGELLIPIKAGDDTTRFEGYTDPKATAKKVLTNVFREGDAYFRSGDLLKLNRNGYYYFVDRIGDTFRWKGENVSTTEVAEVLGTVKDIVEVNVLGVGVPGNAGDGCACMAALVLSDQAELGRVLRDLLTQAKAQLPSYAVPLFVRIQPVSETTGTFKQMKAALRKEGADPSKVADPLYWLNPASKAYEPLTFEVFSALVGGKARL